MDIIEEINNILKEERPEVRDSVFGLSLPIYCKEDIRRKAKRLVERINEATVGKNPGYDSPEYCDYFKNVMIFKEIIEAFSNSTHSTCHLPYPKGHESKTGPRD